MLTLRNEHDYINDEMLQMRLRNHGCAKFQMIATKKQRVYKSPYYRGANMWENLPIEMKMSGSKLEFRKSKDYQFMIIENDCIIVI